MSTADTDGPAANADGARHILLVDGTTEYLARLSRHGLGRPGSGDSYGPVPTWLNEN